MCVNKTVLEGASKYGHKGGICLREVDGGEHWGSDVGNRKGCIREVFRGQN